jgi:hypothetical protein
VTLKAIALTGRADARVARTDEREETRLTACMFVGVGGEEEEEEKSREGMQTADSAGV